MSTSRRLPKVTVEDIGHTRSEKWTTWKASCECGWSYDNIAKTDVQDNARRHRAEHRAARGST